VAERESILSALRVGNQKYFGGNFHYNIGAYLTPIVLKINNSIKTQLPYGDLTTGPAK
jgi:hypothetical protein